MDLENLQELSGLNMLLNVDQGKQKLSAWAQENAPMVQRHLAENGILLIRGLKIYSSKQFGALLQTLFGAPLLEYKYRSTPRTSMKGNVYTATEYNADEVIPQHNENAYSRSWPNRIGFLCLEPAATGGATPISDSRFIYKNLPAELSQKFEEKGVMYVRNYSDLDLPWSEVFQTENRAEVEDYCTENDITFQWIGDNQLRTTQINPAVAQHPVSGEKLWFNQAHLFHVSNLKEDIRTTLLQTFEEENLPRNCYFGDGSKIDEADLKTIRELYENSTMRFDWQKSDLMLLDNMLFTHGREAYTGDRKVLMGMAVPNA